VVRGSVLVPGAVVEFVDFSPAQVELQPPQAATVQLEGEVIEHPGQGRKVVWNVRMQYDPKAREWSGEAGSEGPP
jgi:hypothetical protein